MRIVGGNHRGRVLDAPADAAVRPTADRTRQAVFNILEHAPWAADAVTGAVVLDAFCGTGAMALEALSRGALRALLLDSAAASLDLARRNAGKLGALDRCRLLRADATRPPPAPEAATLAFLDPPYGKALAQPALTALAAGGWLAPGALCVVELAAAEPFAAPDGFDLFDERRYGAARVRFLRWG